MIMPIKSFFVCTIPLCWRTTVSIIELFISFPGLGFRLQRIFTINMKIIRASVWMGWNKTNVKFQNAESPYCKSKVARWKADVAAERTALRERRSRWLVHPDRRRWAWNRGTFLPPANAFSVNIPDRTGKNFRVAEKGACTCRSREHARAIERYLRNRLRKNQSFFFFYLSYSVKRVKHVIRA